MRRMSILTGLLLAAACSSETGATKSPGQAGAEATSAEPTTAEPTSAEPSPSSEADDSAGLEPDGNGGASGAAETPEADVSSSEPEPGAGPSDPRADDTDQAEPESNGGDAESDDVDQVEPETDQGAPEPEADASQVEPEDNTGQLEPDTNPMGDAAAPDPEPETEEPTSDSLSFAADIWPLWIAERDPVFVYRGAGSYSGCADETVPCHGGQSPGAQFSMTDMDTAYSQLMDTPSVSGLCAGTQRVAVGDPDNSCLILFYVGRLGAEDLDWVDDAEIELMREWIRQGALP